LEHGPLHAKKNKAGEAALILRASCKTQHFSTKQRFRSFVHCGRFWEKLL